MSVQTSETIEYRKLSDELIEKLAGFVAQGNYFVTACHACGIGERVLYDWLKQAEIDADAGLDEAVSLPMRLVQALKNAEADAEAERVARVREAGQKGNWLADMTHLERRHPDRWGRKDRTAITIDEHKQVTITTVEIVKDYGMGGRVIESEAKEVKQIGQGEAEP